MKQNKDKGIKRGTIYIVLATIIGVISYVLLDFNLTNTPEICLFMLAFCAGVVALLVLIWNYSRRAHDNFRPLSQSSKDEIRACGLVHFTNHEYAEKICRDGIRYMPRRRSLPDRIFSYRDNGAVYTFINNGELQANFDRLRKNKDNANNDTAIILPTISESLLQGLRIRRQVYVLGISFFQTVIVYDDTLKTEDMYWAKVEDIGLHR